MLHEIEGLVDRDFDEISERVNDIVQNSMQPDQVVREVAEYVSGKLSASCKGYIALLYSVKSKETLREEVFSSSENANKFYDLNLRQKLSESYDFNLGTSRSFNSVIGSSKKKAQSFLLDLKSEMKDFLSGAEHYYDEQVSSLKKELGEKHDS